jgi:hypothetical protein
MQIRGSQKDSKALISSALYGTAEAVPFIQSLSSPVSALR